jgi:CubicO group peptidase (beta-lactamase class C family)
MLVMMAQERGLVSLDAPIGTLLPEFRDKPGPRVKDLLCHAAGFPVYSLDVKYAESGTCTLAGVAAGIAAEPLLAAPGTRFDWEYKDYAMVGYILELLTGKPLPTVLSEWILQPLKMRKTGAGLYPGGKELAWTTRFTQFQESLAQWKGGYLPSDCVYSTVDELELFFSALASGKLISADSYKVMQTALVNDGKDGSGLGFAITPSGAIWEAGHNHGGYRALFWYDPRYDLRIIMLGNRWMPTSGSVINKILCSEIYSALGLKEPT